MGARGQRYLAGVEHEGAVVAAIHVSPDCGNIVDQMIPRIGQPDGPSADWVQQYGNEALQVQELAVDPAHRRRGLGRTLLLEVESHASRVGATSLHGFADERNHGAVDLYSAAGYTVLPRNTPVPPEPICGMRMLHQPYMHGSWFFKVL